MPITETVTIKATGSNLVRTIGFPLKESFNVTDVSTLRLKDGATTLAATFTVGNRWKGLPSDTSKPLKWVHVTFKDTNTARNLIVDDSGATLPATTNPLVITNNTNDIVVSNGVIEATFNKVTDAADLLTSMKVGATEMLHATNKPRLTVPTDKKTQTTWTSGSFDYAAVPTDSAVKVLNASLYNVGDTVKFAWEGTVADYFPTGGPGGLPFIIMASPFTIPDLTRALRTSVHGMTIIIDYGGANVTAPIDFSDPQGFCLLSAPGITPTAGMKIRFQEIEAATTKTIQAINTSTNVITFTTQIGQYIPQGVDLAPTVASSSTANASIVSGGTVIEKQYGDKAIIIKQTCHLKDQGARIENNLTFEIRHWLYADTGFVRSRVTIRNTVQTLTTAACPDILFKALNFDLPMATASSTVSDSVTDMATSVARYKANNLHSSLTHSAVANWQWAIHEFQVQWPNKTSIDATGCHFEIFPATSGPIAFEGGVIKSRNFLWGINAASGLPLLDTLGASFDPAYVALSQAVRPNMVEKRDWSTVFASEPQKFKDACARFERIMASPYDLTANEASFVSRPAMSLYEYRWDYCERAGAQGSYPFGWDRFGNTPDDVGFGNNRFDLPYILFREGLREGTTAKAELAFKLGLQQIRNRTELGQHWTHQSQASGTPDMYGLARYERAYAPDPFNYTNSPIAIPTHSWNEGSCLAWALTDDPIFREAAEAGVAQARLYNYQGSANALLYGSGSPQMGTDSNGGNGAEPRFVGWPIHTLVTGYRYFGVAADLQKAEEYTQSFIATLANEPAQDGFIYFRSGSTIAPLFQHGGYCVMGMIETWRESQGATKTAIGDYIVKVAKFLARGDAQSATVTPNAPMLAQGTAHPTDANKYNPASHMPMSYLRSYSDTLSGGITSTATTIPLNDASTFGLNLNSNRGILIPVGQLNNPAAWEYFTFSGKSGNNLTGVVRGFGGTTAQAFPAGTIVYPTGFNGIENDLVIATLIMGGRISGDATLQQFAQKIFEDNCLYSKRVDGGNPDFVTVGNYQPINLWPINVSSNGLKTMAQAGLSLSEFLGDRVNPPNSPAITSISPSSATAGAAQFTITVNGSNFATDAVVRWGAVNLVTTFVSASQLTAVVTANLLTTPGSVSVTVLNVTDNLTSNSSAFSINPAAPTVSSVSPATATVNVATGQLTITGTNLSGASVTVDAVSVTPTSNTATQIVIPSQTFTTTGNKTIAITTAGGTVNTTISVVNPAPVLSGINPATTNAGSGQLTITLTGSSFVTNSVVRWESTNLVTTFVSPTQLTAIVPANLLTTGGTFNVTVFNPTPGGGTSGAQAFTVNTGVVPAITSLSPSSVVAGDPQFTITVNGSNFATDAVVRLDGVNKATTFINANQLTAVIPATDITTAGTKTITVRNTLTGQTSTGSTLTVLAPNPESTLSGLVPSSVNAGSAQFTLEVQGTGFIASSVIRVNGVNRATTFVDSSHLTCVILASEIANPGVLQITVFNPAPGGGLSDPLQLTVSTPLPGAPTISNIAPTVLVVNQGGQLTITGTNLASASVTFAGQAITPSTNTATQIVLNVPSNLVSTTGAKAIIVTTSGGNVQTSITVNNPAPSVSGISPSSATAGAGQTALTVSGSDFVAGSVVRWNGADLVTSFVNANQLTATIPSNLLTTAGSANVTVFNATPGGGTSNAASFTINPAVVPSPVINSISPTSLTVGPAQQLTINGSNLTGATVSFNGVILSPTSVSATQIIVTIPQFLLTQAGLYFLDVTTSGGNTSLQVTVGAGNVLPAITSLSPSQANAGASATQIVVFGQNFDNDARIIFDGVQLATTFVSSSQLSATIPGNLLTTAGSKTVSVLNVSAGEQTVNSAFNVAAAATPTITSISPATVNPGSSSFTLAVNGSNFTTQSVINVNGSARATNFVSSSRLETVIPALDVQNVGTLSVTVTTQGAGTSAPATLTVQTITSTMPKLRPGMKAQRVTLWIDQGKTFQFTRQLKTADGAVFDLTGVTLQLQARRRPADEEVGIQPLLNLTTANGGLTTDPVNGSFTINMTATDTSALRFERARFEMEATTAEGIVVALLVGEIRIRKEYVR